MEKPASWGEYPNWGFRKLWFCYESCIIMYYHQMTRDGDEAVADMNWSESDESRWFSSGDEAEPGSEDKPEEQKAEENGESSTKNSDEQNSNENVGEKSNESSTGKGNQNSSKNSDK